MESYLLKLDNDAEFITLFQASLDLVNRQDHWLKPLSFKFVQEADVFFVFYEVNPFHFRIL